MSGGGKAKTGNTNVRRYADVVPACLTDPQAGRGLRSSGTMTGLATARFRKVRLLCSRSLAGDTDREGEQG